MAETVSPETRDAKSIRGLIQCPKCGRSNPPETRYCEGCGASLKAVAKPAEAEKKKGLFSKLFK